MYDSYLINLNDYNLSYEFFYEQAKIRVKESFPFKNCFRIIDENDNNYLLIKISKMEVKRYNLIFEVLRFLKESNKNISEMYSIDSKKYFCDGKSYYIIFRVSSGVYNKWCNFDLNFIVNSLCDFYDGSKLILKSSHQKNCLNLLTIGEEMKLIDKRFKDMQKIFNIISYKESLELIDETFLNYKDYVLDEMEEGRKFFLGNEFKNYCENHENIRFINGNLSNRSFLFENGKCEIVNFYSSSIDLFVKDIATFVENCLPHIESTKILIFVEEFFKKYSNNKIHLKVLINYLKIYNYIFKCFSKYYLQSKSYKNVVISDKINEIENYKQNRDDFIKKILLIL